MSFRNRRRSHRPAWTSTKYPEVRSSMKRVFDDSLVLSFQKVVEKSLKEFVNKNDLTSFQVMLRDGMNGISTTIQQRLLELIDNHFVSEISSRKGWVIERKNDVKTVLSPFGPVTYRRTYFKNKQTGKYAYLADKTVGYTAHQRLDILLEADIVVEASECSYSKAGFSQGNRVAGTEVSGQTVLNLVRKFKPEHIQIKEQVKTKRTSRIIYIEADEDHVSHQDKGVRAFEQKLIYVHEGNIRVGKNRNKLIGKKYFTFPPGTKSEEIWNTIWQYLDDTYDLEKTEQIFISGDGAHWIKAGAEYIPNARYVMDGFHLKQAIYKAAGADQTKRDALATLIRDGRWTDMNRLLISFLEEADLNSRKKSIKDTISYFNNNWSGIQAHRIYKDILVGCSAEGHVSHVLSSRLSSRPMGWSYVGANQMAHLRIHRFNGVDIHQVYLEKQSKDNAQSYYAHPAKIFKVLPKASGSSHENLDNIPSLHQGANWSLGHLLRRISNINLKF